MSGLRTATAGFLLLVLAPAAILGWLGFRGSAPLLDELHRAAREEVLRAATGVADRLPGAAAAAAERWRRRLTGVARALATELPFAGPAALLAAGTGIGGALCVRAADGAALLPAGPRDPVLAGLPEWPRFAAWLRDLDGATSPAPSPDAAARLAAEARAFESPALRARALALAARGLPSLADELANVLAAMPPGAWRDAGPIAIEALVQHERGRATVRAHLAELLAVPATEAARLSWFERAGAPADLVAAQRLRAAKERGEVIAVVRAPLPHGAELEHLVDAQEFARTMGAHTQASDTPAPDTPAPDIPPPDAPASGSPTPGSAGNARDGTPAGGPACTVHCAPVAALAAPAFPTAGRATLTVATVLGPFAVTAEHRHLPRLAADARRRQWLTGVGVALLLLLVVAGLALVRRTVRAERAELALRERFLANVSHDLRTPLTSLRLHAELLADPALDDAARARYAAVCDGEGERMAAMIDDLIELAALRRGRREPEPEPIDLGAMARAAAASWRPAFDRAGTALEVRVAPPAEALADPRGVVRIVGNLLQNALRHGRPARDGGTPRVELVVGPGPTLAVRDNGPGLSGTGRDGARAKGTPRGGDEEPGLGLGLALSRELAARNGGALAHRDDGATTFVLTLPPVPPTPDAAALTLEDAT